MSRRLLPLSALLLAACGGAPEERHLSLREALMSARAGQTITLEDGVYDNEHGETWGYEAPQGIVLRGSHNTILRGSGVALAPVGELSLERLTFEGFETAVSATQSQTVWLRDVVLREGAKGVVLDGERGSATISGGAIDGSDYAVELGDACAGCSVRIEGATLRGGLFVSEQDSTLTVAGSEIEGSEANAAINFAGAQLDVASSTVRAGGGPYSITVRSGTATLEDVALEGSSYCVYQIAGDTRLRRTRLTGYGSIGLYLASGKLDLGTELEAGDNAFESSPGSQAAFGLYVDTGTAPVTSSDTSFGGVIPSPGTVQAGTEDLAEPGQYFLTPGQRISFYRVK